MSQARLFVPQETLERWLSEGLAQLEHETLKLQGESFRMASAVRFLAEVTGAVDELGLVGRVKSQDQLAALAADHAGDSVVLGNNAYQVVEGYTLAPEIESVAADCYPRLIKLFARL